MIVVSFIASQRTDHRVPHAVCCRWLGVSESWFYRWHHRPPTARQQRRAELDAAVKASFDDSGGTPGTYGSPRVEPIKVAGQLLQGSAGFGRVGFSPRGGELAAHPGPLGGRQVAEDVVPKDTPVVP